MVYRQMCDQERADSSVSRFCHDVADLAGLRAEHDIAATRLEEYLVVYV